MPHKPARVFLIRKRAALAVGALLAAAAIFGAVNVPAAITAATTARQLPIYCVDRPSEDGKKFCAISFDAAWGEGRLRHTVNGIALLSIKAIVDPQMHRGLLRIRS